LCVFIYQTCDALDGLIGRRTGMYAHPSAELFDHGVDSLVISLVGISIACLFQTGYSWTTMVLLWTFFSNFFLPTWEQKFTGSIHFGPGLNNPTEVQLCGMALLLIKGFFPSLFEIGFIIKEVSVPLYCIGIFIGGIVTIPGNIVVVQKVIEKSKQKTEALLALTPHLSIMAAIFLLFCGNPHPTLVAHPRLVLMMVAVHWHVFIFHLILCEMTKSQLPLPYLFLSQLPLLIFSCGVYSNTDLLTSYPVLLLVACCGAFHLVTLIKRILDEVCLKICGMEHYFSIQDWENQETKKILLQRLENQDWANQETNKISLQRMEKHA